MTSAMQLQIILLCLGVIVLRTAIYTEAMRIRREDNSLSFEENSKESDEYDDDDNDNSEQGVERTFCVRHADEKVRLYGSLCSIHLEPHTGIMLLARDNCDDLKVVRSSSSSTNLVNVDPSHFVCGLKNAQYEWYCSPCAVERNGAIYKRKRRCPQKLACKPSPGSMIPGDGLSGTEPPPTATMPLTSLNPRQASSARPTTTQQSPTDPLSQSPTATNEQPRGTTLHTNSPSRISTATAGTTNHPAVTSSRPPESSTVIPPVEPQTAGPPSPAPGPRATEAPSVTTGALPDTRSIFPPLQQFCLPESPGRYSCPCPPEEPPAIDFRLPNILIQKFRRE